MKYVVGKQESTPYTAETLVDADFKVAVENLTYSNEIKMFRRKILDGFLDQSPMVPGKQSGKVGFMIPLTPGATVATQPKWSHFLESCGFKVMGWDGGVEVAVGSAVEGISWVLHAEKVQIPCTIETAELSVGASPKQLITKLRGCMGNVQFMIGEVGEPIQMVFDFSGALVSIADQVYASKLDPTSLSTVLPPAVLAACVTVGGVNQICDKFEINPNASVVPYTDPNKAEGIRGFYIGSWDPSMTVDPNMELLADDPVYPEWLAGTPGAVSIIMNSTPNLTLSAPVAQYETVTVDEREESSIAGKTFRLLKSSGNDSIELLQGAKS
jgi:hypothetical protein